jgi:hypothetical protein
VLISEYIKNSYNSTIKKETQFLKEQRSQIYKEDTPMDNRPIKRYGHISLGRYK